MSISDALYVEDCRGNSIESVRLYIGVYKEMSFVMSNLC